jgi:four helix bundle protein
MHDFRKLRVWEEAIALADITYAATRGFSPEERYELARHMRRTVVSIASNIAEGAGRGSDPDFRRFLRIANGSACELETQALIAQAQSLGSSDDIEELILRCDRLRQGLAGLIQRLGPGPADDRS